MTQNAVLKQTSWEYGEQSQLGMVGKYRNRANNHWKERIGLGLELVREHVPVIKTLPPSSVVVADVGCSIGTFAIEFAKVGYQCYGVDFDPVALDWARRLAAEEGVQPTFMQMDVAEWGSRNLPNIHVAVCFDIFEHLHDDEIGSLLQGVRRQLAPGGCVVFSTTPTQYSYMYVGGSFMLRLVRWLMFAFTWLPEAAFERVLRSTAAMMDAFLILRHGKDHREIIKRHKHCNLLTHQRLEDILLRAGYSILKLETLNLHPHPGRVAAAFRRHKVCDTHIVGVATPSAAVPPNEAPTSA